MAYRFVCFDLDGTLLDTSQGIWKSILYTTKKMGLVPPDEKELHEFIGPPIQKSLGNYYQMDSVKAIEAASIFREIYRNKFLLEAKPYDGIYELLGALQKNKLKTAVATYKRQDYACELLDAMNFTPFFDYISGSDLQGKLVKADIIKKCLVSFGDISKTDAVYIGDTVGDYNSAKECGIDFIGVGYGFGLKHEKEMTIADSCDRLRAMLIGQGQTNE